MSRSTSLLWVCVVAIFLSRVINVNAYLGINWGRMATQRFVPSMVVDLLLQNGIPELRIFQPSGNVLTAFAGTDIGLIVTMQENYMKSLIQQNKILAQEVNGFISERIEKFAKNGVKIRCIYIGNEPFTIKYSEYKKTPFNETVRFLNFTRNALDYYDLRDIKVTTPHFTDVLTTVSKPSEGDFRPDIKDKMIDFVRFINQTGAPFVINIFPIYSVYDMGLDLEFAFFDNKSNFTIVDGNNTYSNLFTFMYDELVHALRKAGYGDLEIVVGQIGWPTDGYKSADVKNAERFHRGLLKYIGSKKGTPLRPNKDITMYLLGLTDENNVVTEWGPYQRHWGIYKHDGSPKFKIDFTLQDRDIKPTTAKGTVKMPNRWCVYDGEQRRNLTLVMQDVAAACAKSDCSSLTPGATCDNLNLTSNISYAYNMRFQMSNQIKCDLEGAMITPYNPSTEMCDFPIEILTADITVSGTMLKFKLDYELNIGVPLLIALFVALRHDLRLNFHNIP